MTVENIAASCNGTIYKEDTFNADNTGEVTGIVIDSRLVKPGYVFVAAKGEKTDGHRFINSAFDKGAMAVICEHLPKEPYGTCILVKDSFEALRRIAAYYRSQFSIPVIGITGSVGKTSTKEFIASVLSQRYNVLKTEGNYNNEVGLPLTVFGLNEHHEAAVLEMGINTFGEMHRLSEIARPDMVVMTNIGECHLEFLHDRDGVLKAKSEIFDFMNRDGTVFINADDDKLSSIKEVYGKKPVRFGFDPSYDVWADSIADTGLSGSSAVIHTPEGSFKAQISLPGRHMIGNAMAAAAVGLRMGLNFEEISQGISSVLPVEGRSHLVRTGSITIIDDCYNANPASVRAAIDLLSSSGTRTVAVLGDMFELGENEKQMHYDIGCYAIEHGIDVVLCAGDLSRSMYEGAAETAKGMAGIQSEITQKKSVSENIMHLYRPSPDQVRYFVSREDLIDALPQYIRRGDTVLVKASHGMQYAGIVDALKTLKL